MKPITTSTSTLENLIEGGFAYVDKTGLIRELLRPADAALEQIRTKDYAARLRLRGKPITFLGVSFDSARRTVAEWKAEKFAQ